MINHNLNCNVMELHQALWEANQRIDQVEVLLNNLLCLKSPGGEQFVVPFDDVLVSLETAVKLLAE